MVAEVKRVLGRDLPPSTLTDRFTIESLARELATSERPSTSFELVTLQPLGDKPPLVFMPSIGGTAMLWRDLLAHWQPDRPVYALSVVGDAVPWPENATVPEIAASYLDCLRKNIAGRKIHLAGYSFGGPLALEMAQQLRALGDEVGTIVAIDAGPGELLHSQWPMPVQRFRWFLENLPRWVFDKLLRTSLKQLRSDVWRKTHRLLQALRHLRDSTDSGYINIDSAVDTRGMPDHHVARMQILFNAMKSYYASPYD
jgi:thioesterase domain-containing protein